VKDLTYTSEDN